MSRRRNLQKKLGSLGEIEDIMTAMKNLAFMETRKLTGFLSAQQQAVAAIEAAAADFSNFYGKNAARKIHETALLVGSERGLCGDFNEMLIAASSTDLPVVAIGRRLESKLAGHIALMAGPNVAEEVEKVLTRAVDFFAKMQSELPPEEILGITAFYHSDETGGVRRRRLLPLPDSPASASFSHPPILHLDPAVFYEKLSEHYLYAALHEALCSSLMMENRYRLDHMDNAIRQMDRRIAGFRQRYNELRQEEITEEIEVIMLSAEALAG